MDDALVAGRACGPCNVCCVVPAIDEAELQKLPGCRCHNALPDGGCGIYERRPQTCRTFYCGWRRFAWIGDGLRPDLSGVFIWPGKDESSEADAQRVVTMVALLTDESLDAEGLAEAILVLIEAGHAVHLMIPGPPGHTSCGIALNELLGDAVRESDKPAILNRLREVRAAALANIDKTEPFVFAQR
jgi:hypothetical protein